MNSERECLAPTVVIIGCGPSGISFLHAVALRKQKMEDEGDLEGLSKLPIVTCFERAAEPGGVWRAQRACLSDMVTKSFVESSTDDSSSDGGDYDTEASSLVQYFSAAEVGGEPSPEDCSQTTGKDSVSDESSSSESSYFSESSSDDEDEENYLRNQASQVAKKKGDAVLPIHCTGTNMYEALWTNGPKEAFEYFDYTFEDHFKHDLPVYMPRQYLLEYMLKRVTRNNPNVFLNHVRFNTQVNYVCYNEIMKKFEVTFADIITKEKSTLNFDKCIWGAGENGIEKIPRLMSNLLCNQRFLGSQMHSSKAGSCLNLVQGKRILLVGDAYSAEDLTLQCLKLGAEKVYILSRSGNGVCNMTKAWPGNKVQILNNLVITAVIQGGNGLRLSEAPFNVKKYRHNIVPGGKTMDLIDISSVIYCTGYQINFTMLDPILIKPYVEYLEEGFPMEDSLLDWEMTSNILSDTLVDIEPGAYIESDEVDVYPGVYRGILLSNPNMMFLKEGSADSPLLEIDVRAWFFLNHIIGDYKLPGVDEVTRINRETVTGAMNVPGLRYMLDVNYQHKYVNVGLDHWIHDQNDHRYIEIDKESSRFNLKLLAQEQIDGTYPFTIGTREKLNEKGELLLHMAHESEKGRTMLDPEGEDSDWKTFRDMDPSSFESLHTGNKAVQLKNHWIDLDDHDPNLLNA